MDAMLPEDDRFREKRDAALMEALRIALTHPGEHRLYRSGKLHGLFAMRTGPIGEAAAMAIRNGLFEQVRTENRGKSLFEWVKVTPKGVEYLHTQDSPRAVLNEMRHMLRGAREGIPHWQDAMLQSLEKLGSHINDEMVRYLRKLDALTVRVEEALRRAETSQLHLGESLSNLVPWGLEALTYLDHRRDGGAPPECPFPELFNALREHFPKLTMRDFHDGLRRLADHRAFRLAPNPAGSAMTEPEYVLQDGGRLLYVVVR